MHLRSTSVVGSVFGSVVGLVVGSFVGSPVGSRVGSFVGSFVGSLVRVSSWFNIGNTLLLTFLKTFSLAVKNDPKFFSKDFF